MTSALSAHQVSQNERMGVEKTNTFTLLLLEEAQAYQAWLFKQIRPFLQGDILEVGCGIGNLTGFFLSYGRVCATDVQEKYLEVIREKYGSHPQLIGTLVWDIRTSPFQHFQRSFDTLVCSNVLEHIEDDLTVLHHFYQILSARGRLVLLVPALKWLYNPLDQNLGHVRRYARKELATKMRQSGFRLLQLTYFNPFGMLGWFVNGSLLRRRLLPEQQVRVFNRFVPLFRFLEQFLPRWTGQSLIAIGEK